MSEEVTYGLRIMPDGIFYIAYGQVRHFARKEAIQEIICTEEGVLITFLGAGADQFEIPIPFDHAQALLSLLERKGWPVNHHQFLAAHWPIEEDESPF